MTTLYLTHDDCLLHDMGAHHPESPDRLRAINRAVEAQPWYAQLHAEDAPRLDPANLYGVHPPQHVDALLEIAPGEGLAAVDGDTILNPHSIDAALRAAGAAVYAADKVIDGQADNAFCAVRPPGHHAEATVAMGFCLFNNVALAAERALARGLERVAVLDFDVHHGNGTVQVFLERPEVLVCSSFQYPFYPGRYDDVQLPNICLTPLTAGTDGSQFRQAVERDWSAALHDHQPEMILVSAGFDAHRDDPLGGLRLDDADYRWAGEFIGEAAEKTAEGRMLAVLEGGYDLGALSRAVVEYIGATL